mmetsp:Transcript_25920/g.76812  ORF Transcript_25920/g.76812 Transcript_25920/m.76812 type:complete len:250 (+) Transcript_25920:1783-2532(+)
MGLSPTASGLFATWKPCPATTQRATAPGVACVRWRAARLCGTNRRGRPRLRPLRSERKPTSRPASRAHRLRTPGGCVQCAADWRVLLLLMGGFAATYLIQQTLLTAAPHRGVPSPMRPHRSCGQLHVRRPRPQSGPQRLACLALRSRKSGRCTPGGCHPGACRASDTRAGAPALSWRCRPGSKSPGRQSRPMSQVGVQCLGRGLLKLLLLLLGALGQGCPQIRCPRLLHSSPCQAPAPPPDGHCALHEA